MELNEGDKKLKGYSFTQLIHKSSISGHFMRYTGDCYIDIFSCKDFDTLKIKDCIQNYFLPKKINSHFILRDASI